MDNLEVVKALKEPAIEIMKEKRILASFVISSALYFLSTVSEEDSKTLFAANNVMMRTAGKKFNNDIVFLESVRGKRYKVYPDHISCIKDWLLSFRSSTIREVWNFDILINRLTNKEYTKANLKPLIDAYKLDDIDKEVLEKLYPSNQNLIEVPVTETKTIKYQQLAGYNDTLPEPKPVSKVTSAHKEPRMFTYSKGEKSIVRAANIFADPTSRVAGRSFTGNVWLYDGICRNGRYAIVTNKTSLTKDRSFIDGYIKKEQLK